MQDSEGLALACTGSVTSRGSYFLNHSFLIFTVKKMRIVTLLILGGSYKDNIVCGDTTCIYLVSYFHLSEYPKMEKFFWGP